MLGVPLLKNLRFSIAMSSMCNTKLPRLPCLSPRQSTNLLYTSKKCVDMTTTGVRYDNLTTVTINKYTNNTCGY